MARVARAVQRVTTGVDADSVLRNGRPSGTVPLPNPQRSEGARDGDRVLYSAAWRRLAGVTQVVTPFEGQATLHNRLTHSEKVAQVARAVALNLLGDVSKHETLSRLGGYSADVCFAAGLAHDIGHPPFGHIGEEVLDDIARNDLKLADGFEGNAQSFRILSTRRLRSGQYEGLDLTYATLAAVAKYPWGRVERSTDHAQAYEADPIYKRHWDKFNAYQEQVTLLEDSRRFVQDRLGTQIQTLEASTMDVADDITYAIHDLEDFYLSGMLNVSQILQDLTAAAAQGALLDVASDNPFIALYHRLSVDYPAGWTNTDDFTKGILKATTLFSVSFGGSARVTTSEDEANVRSQLSDQISDLLNAVDVSENPAWDTGPHISLSRLSWHYVQILKTVTKNYVIRDPDVALLQFGQQTILRELIDMLQKWGESDKERLPRILAEEINVANTLAADASRTGYDYGHNAPRGSAHRAYLDYLCTLTDAQCISLHEKLSGRSSHRSVVGTAW